MYEFKARALYPVRTNPFMFVYRFLLGNFFVFKACTGKLVRMTMRTWPQEAKSVHIYPFTCLYENSILVGIRFGRRFQISPFGYLFRWLNVNVSILVRFHSENVYV